ncbi:Covalently-linked cell wall protein 14 [Lactiplantibacillus plantarum]|nr:Covalently-linked cell wall protein 14 [Lactiplantibacillus plantarum]MCG0880321.1 Covalently-linked cell wall protein 14 [Lactiplantibacillus plantarum]
MAFVQLLVIIFFIAILATIYFGIRWIISKFTNHNNHYGRKALISISAIAGVLAIVGITNLISNHNEQKLDQEISAQDNSDSSNKKKAQISKINGTDAPDSMDDYTITVNNKKSINVTGKATPNSKIDVTSDYLNDKNTHADKNGNFNITMHLNKGKKNEYLLTAKKSGYEESNVTSVVIKPQKSTDIASSSDSETTKSATKSQEKQNYQHYLTALSKAPDTTKGALTKAYYDDKNNYAVFVLDDAALSQSSNSLKTISKAAWDAGNRLYQEYKPFPSGVVPNMIKIEDSQGNIIAETSFTGNFKYTGE